MKENIEIELKFEITSDNNLRDFLKNLEYVSQKKVKDVYFDTRNYKLFKKGIFIRIRNDSLLDFKFNPEHFYKNKEYNIHDHCDELSFKLPLKKKDLKNLKQITNLLNLKNAPNYKSFKKENKLTREIVIDKKKKKI